MTPQLHPDDFIVGESLLLIYIGRSIGKDLSIKYPADVYACVSGYWKRRFDREKYKNCLVLARNTDRVLGAYRIKTAIPSPEPESGRWGFEGGPAELSTQLRYVGKRVPDQYRTQNPTRFIQL